MWIISSYFFPPAYDILSDPEKRKQYDMFGADGPANQGDGWGGGGAPPPFHFNYDSFFGNEDPHAHRGGFHFNFDDMFDDSFFGGDGK